MTEAELQILIFCNLFIQGMRKVYSGNTLNGSINKINNNRMLHAFIKKENNYKIKLSESNGSFSLPGNH
ncbi:MAG: hypothetical protein COY19_01310 [Candidatus Marinimicrobia bacterium CG_4_10_14_0_2_um_filter_48_9]|nr:MAG: hypothetical protein COY19_01310 [Candidatus Marinimicrobia bacterium CG_4_10_14_0_2_um_filter_48_9]